MIILGKRIQELRKHDGLTQEKLAAEMGVSVAAVSKWENEVAYPDVHMLSALADFFQVSCDNLLGRENASSKYFLICDDAMFIGSVMTDIIVGEGYTAKAVNNSNWLYNEIQKRKPNGIFLDVHFPEENGLDILAVLKEKYPNIPVVIVTADMTEETRVRAEELKAEQIVYKPFAPEKLVAALKAILPA